MKTLDFIHLSFPQKNETIKQLFTALAFRTFDPYHIVRTDIVEACAESLTLPDRIAFWHLWELNFQRSIRDFYRYPQDAFKSMPSQVVVSDPTCLDQLRRDGGLVLTYHTHHQNTLCCALGMLGSKIWAIANRPESSPLYPFIGHWASKLNRSSESHFRGGQYLYTDDLKSIAVQVPKLFLSSSALVCLVDVHQPSPRSPKLKLFNRLIEPPVGVIESARKAGAPFYLALLIPNEGSSIHPPLHATYELRIEQISNTSDSESILRFYFQRLEQLLQSHPYLWQGWQWLDGLPSRDD